MVKKENKILKFMFKPRSLPLSQKIFFVQQLGVMLKAGISLAVGLKTLADQTNSKSFKFILLDLQKSVEKGQLLSRGLESYKRIFGDLFINMVKAGEISGKLEEVLKQLFIQLKKDHDLISKVRGAMIYPVIVVAMMVGIGVLMLIYVIPSISSVFKELNVPLPIATRILISVSDFVVAYGFFILVSIVILAVMFARIRKIPQGKLVFDEILLFTPIIGPIIRKINLARFARTMSSLLKTDIPIVQSFEITSDILGNAIYKRALVEAKEEIKKGVSIEESLHPHQRIFPPVILQMIAIGEDTGSLDEILSESANFYEEEVGQTMSNLPSIIEPLLMIVLGFAVGGMAIAVIMPMYSLSQSI